MERIDTITGWEGAVFRRFILSSLNSYKEYLYDDEERKITGDVVWLEGIGSSAGLFLPWQPLQPRGVVLLNCHSDAFYAATPDFEYKNTTVPVTSSYSDVRQDSFSYDLQGRPLSTPPSRGMYIQNRKKVIKWRVKAAIEREQSHARMSYAEREQARPKVKGEEWRIPEKWLSVWKYLSPWFPKCSLVQSSIYKQGN